MADQVRSECLWLAEIADRLRAAEIATLGALAETECPTPTQRAYARGVRAALVAVAAGCGIEEDRQWRQSSRLRIKGS